MNNGIRISDLYDSVPAYLTALFESAEYPWQVLPRLKSFISLLLECGIEGYSLLKEGVLVGKNVSIAPTATIEAPAIIGEGTELRPGAYLRGNVIVGKGCVIGNATELKHCILLDSVQVPHYNYVGDSVLGNRAHMGAGAICSNLKSDGTNVVIRAEQPLDTGLRKVGSFLGDHADIGCGCVLNPGTVVGGQTSVYPLTALRGVYPSHAIVKDARTVVPKEEREI
ncbi:MAG: UDP-N-acetylglucosamine pyrophosphorylase [Ruminococcaceae bacterium]|nr:UDP-N-acetylglucosamine pyrophosphorylase [Oscillospiraceae bacterium]